MCREYKVPLDFGHRDKLRCWPRYLVYKNSWNLHNLVRNDFVQHMRHTQTQNINRRVINGDEENLRFITIPWPTSPSHVITNSPISSPPRASLPVRTARLLQRSRAQTPSDAGASDGSTSPAPAPATLLQDVVDIKTLLLQLKRVLQEVRNTFMESSWLMW